MSNVGWIKLHRKILNWEWYKDSNVCRVYRHKLLHEEGAYSKPDDSVAFQMMCAVSNYTPKDLNILEQKCSVGGRYWSAAKDEYAEYLDSVFKKWPKDKTLDRAQTISPVDMFLMKNGGKKY